MTMLPGPEKQDCGCGCGLFGTLRVKTWRNGQRCVRLCQCRRCVGGRQRPKATRRESKIAKDTGGSREPLSGALSGVDGRSALWVWEETANVSIVRGFKRWIEGKGTTTKISRMMAKTGVRRAFIVGWDGKPQWAIVPYADWAGQVKDDNDTNAYSGYDAEGPRAVVAAGDHAQTPSDRS